MLGKMGIFTGDSAEHFAEIIFRGKNCTGWWNGLLGDDGLLVWSVRQDGDFQVDVEREGVAVLQIRERLRVLER
jgi:hypothetical protein